MQNSKHLMIQQNYQRVQAPSGLFLHYRRYFSLLALTLLATLSACSSSEPELRFSESFIGEHNFTVVLNSAGDGLDISFNSQSDASYELFRSSTKACTSSSATDSCADYLDFTITGEGAYSDSLPERTYYYKLAVSLPGISEDFSAQYPPLDPPSSVSASAGDKQITLSWRGVSGASSYNLYGARVSGVTPDNYASLEDGFSVTEVASPYMLTNLINGTTYYLILTSVHTDGTESTYSDEINATPVISTDNISAPVFTSASTATAPENSTSAFYTAIATDVDGDSVSYSISGGADAAFFTLDATSGVLSFINPPDYENPSDSNSDNIYSLSLLASDGVDSSAALALTVTVLDLTEIQADYNLSSDEVVINYNLGTDTPEGASVTLYRAEEPIGTATCSVLDGISGCINGAFWADAEIPSTDSINWSARRYYQLDISVDGVIIDRVTADLAVSDYLTMADPTVSTNGYEFDLSWQALPNLDSYSLYIATDADATSALEANWSSLEGSQIINDLNETHYLLDPDSNNTTLYFALSATNSEGVSTDLAPLHKLDNIDHVSDGSVWFQTTASAGWSARNEHTSVVFDDKLWVIGGYDGSREDDVWYSADGVTWTQATATAGWSARDGHTSVVFDDKLWVIGGYDGSLEGDVWYSADGVTWNQATATAGWSARYKHTSVVFDDKLWVIGGFDGSYKDDVWYSEDGITWLQATATAGWSARYEHTSVVFDDKLWVIGGDDGSSQDDVWYSEDGVNWTQATATAGWSARADHTSVVFDDKLWVIGGYDGSRQNDVWYSADGVDWTQTTADAGWSGRYDHTSAVFNDKLWVLGGYDGSREDDVWYSPLLINTFNFTPLDYDYAPARNQAPAFTSATSAIVDENTIVAYTANGDDPDNGTLAFAITGGTDADLFSIDASSGELAFLKAPDYENPADSNADNNYSLTLQLHDGSTATELDLVVSVSNVVEALPAPQGLSAQLIANELRLSWEAVSSANLDGGAASYNIYYATSGGVNADNYSELAGSAERDISTTDFTFALNSFSADTRYYFAVSAENSSSESPESDELSVLISADINNSSPLFTSSDLVEVPENTAFVFHTASANDSDGDDLSYALSGGADAALFALDSSSGELNFIAAPDYEAPTDSDGNNLYSLTLSVSDAYYAALQSLSVSVADMAANANLQAEYNSSANLVDISFNLDNDLSYQLLRSYAADCAYQSISSCSGGVELAYTEAGSSATATDSINFDQTQYYQLIASDSESRTEIITTSINGAEQLQDFVAAHQLLVEYNSSTDLVDIHLTNFPDAASYTLHRAQEPIGTATCSVIDGISGCTNGASWSDTAIPSTDAIDWSARNYYQLDISVDDVVIDRLTADLAVSDYLTMSDPTVSTDGYEFNLSWQALPNVSSYSLYIATDANATTATDANWSSLASSRTISAISSADYSLDPNGADALYLALTATNQSGQTTNLAPLYLLYTIDYTHDASNWTQATATSSWSARDGHTSVVFDDKLWVIGGYDGSLEGDVWYSADGVTWNQATATAGWSARYKHTSVVFDDKLWVIGGYDGSRLEDDVWYSADGVTWNQATATAGWSARYKHTSVVFDDKLWVIGGYDGSRLEDDVWYSADGVTWTQATATAGWSARYDHTSVVFNDKLWVIGGYDGSRLEDDVWYSADGVTWTQATATAGWSARYDHTSAVFNDKLWVLGGYDGSREDDVWYSADGVTWTQATATAGWSARYDHTSAVFNDKLWVLGGYDGSREDDVWYSPLLINTFNFTPLDYDYAPARNQAPAFTSATSAIVDENTIVAYTANGDDPDNGTLAFAITGGTDADLFSIDASSGELAFLKAPDYENPADSDADNVYQLALRLSDGSADSDLEAQITVANVVEVPPAPTGLSASLATDELRLSWDSLPDDTDGDILSYNLYYSQSSGIDSADDEAQQSNISANSFTFALSNFSADTRYYFAVSAQNEAGAGAESEELSVLITSGVNNSSPSFTSTAPTAVSENTVAAFYTASASDADNDDLVFTISGGDDAALFAIGSSSGELRFLAVPDYEIPADSDADNIYSLTLSVSDAYATALQPLSISVTDMAAGADFRAEYNASVNLVDLSFNTDNDLSYQLLRSYEPDCVYSAIDNCSGGVELQYSQTNNAASATDSIDFEQTQYYQLVASDAEGRIELFTATVSGAEQIDDFAAAHQLLVEYNSSTDLVDIHLTNFPDDASYALHRAEEPIGTATCSVIDGISNCANGASWSDTAIPSTDAIDWSTRSYYQLDISVDGTIIDRLTADLAVSDHLTMAEPTVSAAGYEFNLSWQALPNLASYSLYLATDADAISATKDNWVNLEGAEIITDLSAASYLLDPDSNTTLYLALSATNSDGNTTGLAPLYQLDIIDYVSDGSTWVEATDAAGWSARRSPTSVILDNQLWVIGGYDGGYEDDVWYSDDGTTWHQVTAAANWLGRYAHTSAIFNNQLWLLGGYSGSYRNDVWYSDGGDDWEQATTPSWSGREHHTSALFKEQLWVLGGYDGSSRLNDVWYSSDGESWIEATATMAAVWDGRSHHTSAVFKGKLWVMGGYHSSDSRSNEVWYSDDGVNWVLATANANWSERYSHTSVVYDDKLWVLGGHDGSNRLNDVWYSDDGVSWVQAAANTSWSARNNHNSIVFNSQLWVFGGTDGSRLNDVWYSPALAIGSFTFNPLDYDYAPLQNQGPAFTSATSSTITENTIAAYTASGDDPDNGTLAFAIAGGADAALFVIDPSSGELSFITAPDYENPADSDTDNNYTLTLQLHDGSADSELDLVVSVTDFIEIPPAPKNFSAQLATSELRLSWEDLSANYDVGAVSYNLYYATSAGVNADNYAELGGSVEHSVSDNNFTFALSDLTADTRYHFAVSATNELGEGEESDELSVLITSGVDNSSPLFTSAESAEVIENTITAFYTATASDADADDLAFAISGGADAALFSLDPDSGELSFIVAPDYEAPTDSDADNIYSLTLSVSDAYATALHSLSVSITDMAVGVNLQAEYNSSANLVDISFNTESDLDYQLFRSYDSDCAYQSVDDCSSGVKLDYAETDTAASTTDTIDFAQTQYYQLVVTDSESRTEIISTAIVGAEQLDDFAAAHQLLVEYNLNNDLVDIHIDNFPDAASYTLHRAQEPIGTETCSVLDGISGCANGTSWSDSAIPSTDTIDWSARNYYQLDISVDDIVIDRLTADLAVSDYLTMAEPTVATDGYQFNLSWQALPNVASYSLYIATDADATSATKDNWVSLEGSEIITDLATASYLFDPDGNSTLYLALSATNTDGTATNLAPLYQLNSIDYVSDGSVWVEATDSANWSERIYHSSAVFDDMLWVIGGYDGSNRLNDVWYSEDGMDWVEAISADWSARRNHATIVSGNQLWVLGGDDGSKLNDVWYSEDGASWTEIVTAGWSGRDAHRSVVFDNKLWVLGGQGSSSKLNDVWYSGADFESWVEATETTDAGWAERSYHTSVVFQNKLWVLGGWNGSNAFNDVWYSEEGATWEQATEDANWSARSSHTSVVFDDKIWVLGGYSGGKTDVWYSEDGTNWTQATAEASWSGRYDHTSVVFRNKLWVLGGWDGSSRLNDVWYSPLLINTFNFTPLDYDYAPAQNQAPAFTSATSAIVDENTIDAYTATGTDPDNGTLAFAITGGDDAELFTIDSSSGELSFLQAPDYENPTDSDADNNYSLNLQVSDGSATDEQSLTINVVNVEEVLPVPTNLNSQLLAGELRLSWDAVPDGLDGGSAVYNLYRAEVSGVDAANYSELEGGIKENNITTNSFGFSNLVANTRYYFAVSSENSLGESSVSTEISVLITADVNNSSPFFTSPSSVEIPENTTTAFYTATASDTDNDDLAFAIASGADAALFDINSTSGELSFLTAPDYEAPTDSNADNVYSLTLSVADTYAISLQPLTISVSDMATGTDLQAEYNASVNLVDISFNTESGSSLSYTLQRSYDADCDYLQPSACSGHKELAYTSTNNVAIATDDINLTQTQYYQLLASDDDGRTELFTTSVSGTEQQDDFLATQYLLAEYNLSTDQIDLSINSFIDTVSYTLYGANEPIGTATCSVLDGIEACPGGISWSDADLPSTDTINWSARRYYQLDISVDGVVIDRLFADLAVRDYLLMTETTVSEDDQEFNLNWQSLPNIGSYSLYTSTDAAATGATDTNWSSLDNYEILSELAETSYSIDFDTNLYLALTATNSSGVSTSLAPLYLFDSTEYILNDLDYDYQPLQNQAPAFTTGASISVDENSIDAHSGLAVDPDYATLAFIITGGADAELFAIDSSSGELSFIEAPDYENPTDSDADNDYSLSIQVSDGSAVAEQSLTISVLNVEEILPVPTNLSSQLVFGELRLNWDAIPDDLDGGPAVYNLYYRAELSGVDSANYSKRYENITTNSFTISDLATDTKYYFVVSAENDLGESAVSTEISVLLVEDVNNSSPFFTSAESAIVLENTATAFYTASASDADDADKDNLAFAIAGGADSALFDINSTNGKLSFLTAPDYEAPTDSDADNLYLLVLSVSDAYASVQQAITVSVTDMAAGADLRAEYNSSTDLIAISSNTESDLSYQLLRSYEADCDYLQPSACSGNVELEYDKASGTASDSINFAEIQHYQLVIRDLFGRTEVLTAEISGSEQLADLTAAHDFFVDYNLSTGQVDITYTSFPEAASYTLYRADEPIGTATCSVLGGISACANSASWTGTGIPSTDTINWNARRYYQLDIIVDGVVADSLIADIAVADDLLIAQPTVSDNGYEFNLSWQALPNVASYSLYIATDANATTATDDNWSSLAGAQTITAITDANYSLYPDGAGTLYLALTATNEESVSTDLAPLYQINIIDYSVDASIWLLATDAPSWSGRSEHASVEFNNKLWVIGGGDDDVGYKNDVWYSEDGSGWAQATSGAKWSGRSGHTSLVFNNKLWVIGGNDGSYRNDVWHSEDGEIWYLAKEVAEWSARCCHTSVVFDSKLWVLGGIDDDGRPQDVWYSEDGIKWTEATASTPAGWSGRTDHTSVVFDDKIWVIGGQDGSNTFGDVWYSENGASWTEVADSGASWSNRYAHASAVLNDKIWLSGGYDGDYQSDVWYSEDGIDWVEATSAAGWSGRQSHTSTVLKNQLWTLGGNDGSLEDDVWYSPLIIGGFTFTPLDYDYSPLQNQAPILTSAAFSTVSENTTAAYTATGEDPDAGIIVFAITSGTDANLFAIDSSSGELSFLVAPDYENPSDSNADNNYSLSLQVSDGSAVAEQSLTISVINVEEILPAPTNLSSQLVDSELRLAWDVVPDDLDGGVAFYNVYRAQVSGVDAANYSELEGGIKENNITTNSVAFNDLAANTRYYFAVSAENSLLESAVSNEMSVLFAADTNNSSPYFTSASSVSVSENTSAVFYQAAAQDIDGDAFALALDGGADAELFNFDSSTGELNFLIAPDYEAPSDSDADNVYSLVLSASDEYSVVRQTVTVSVTDMAAGANLQAEYNASTNLVDISFNTESGLSYDLFRSYIADCDHQAVNINCEGDAQLTYSSSDGNATASDSIDLTQTQYYQLVITSGELTEVLTVAVVGSEQLNDFAGAHQLLVEYNLSTDLVDIHINNFPDSASYMLYRSEEPIGTDTCSILDGISACTNDASWVDNTIPSTDTIDWSARNYYQLDILVDNVVIDSLTADLAVSDYLIMTKPTVAADTYSFDLSWQALPNAARYSLYLSTDANATSATDANWSLLADAQTLADISSAAYSLDPDGAAALYLALTATNESSQTTSLSPLYLLDIIAYQSDGADWEQATDTSASWPNRYAASSAVFDDKLWIIGGNNDTPQNDVWYSENGDTWSAAINNAEWSAREYHTTAVFGDKLWVLGGDGGSSEGKLNDAWYSTDGVTWLELSSEAEHWSARSSHTSVVFADKLWVLGGRGDDNKGRLNDIWSYDADDSSWSQATNSAAWSARYGHSSVVFDDKIWVLGGNDETSYLNDIWYSADGVRWEQTESVLSDIWSARALHSSLVFDDKLWVFGGVDGNTIQPLNDVWYSDDGINWQQATAEADWSARHSLASAVFNEQMWLLGGFGDAGSVTDVWYSVPRSIEDFNFTNLDYDYQPLRNQVPSFTSNNIATVDENNLFAQDADGTDPDGGTLAFTITGGADAELFTIDLASGELSFSAAPDYENPTDSGADNNYSLSLRISDGSATAEQSLTVSVSNVAELPTAPTGLSSLSNGSNIALQWQPPSNAATADINLRYSLYVAETSGVNPDNYAELTGGFRVSDISATSHTLSDLSIGTSYYFVVSATNDAGEGAASDQLRVLLSEDANNNAAPVFTSTAPTEIQENITGSFYTVTASDADNDELILALSGGADAELFSFDPASGELSFLAAPDYENPTDSDVDNIYSLTLSVADSYTTALQSLAISVTDMAATADLQAEYNSSVNRVDLSFNTESSLGYQLQRSYEADCDYSAIDDCSGGVELQYNETNNAATTTDSIDFAETQYYQLIASDAEGRTELIATSIAGAEQLDDFIAAHQLLVEYNLSSDRVDIHIDNFPEATNASYALYRAEEPLGTDTCSILYGISACTNDASWSDAAIPSTDAIDWSARRYYQLDIIVDDVVIDRLTADLAVSDYLTMAEPTISTDGYEFNLSWQALPNVASYSLYIATDANATTATDANWSSLAGAQTIDAISRANYSLYPNGAETLYLALTATDQDGATTALAPLYQLNSVDYSVDASTWRQATDAPGWSARYSYASTVFNNQLWVIGGYDASGYEDDVWYSDDGASWYEVTAAAEWTGRRGHSNVIFNDQIWIFGGYNGSSRLNDVWYSGDGGNWDQATAPGWSERSDHTSVIFKEQLWVLGGYDGSSRFNDVWYSTDGDSWVEATATTDPGWVGRNHHSSAVFKDKLWILGGHDDGSNKLNDIWHTEDGVNWELATEDANWSGRFGHTSVVFDNKLWVLGGYNGSSRYNDVWHSDDGINWTQATAEASWSGRYDHTSVVFRNKLWVLGGWDGSSRLNDVWYSPLIINSFNFNPIDYDYIPTQNQAPAFTSDASDSAIVNENTIDAYTAAGEDPDYGTLAFTITGGADAELFTINSSSGELAFLTAPDHENPSDSDADNIYQVSLGIHDGSASGADLSLAITVVNDTSEPPTTPVGLQASASDAEVYLSWQVVNDASHYLVQWNKPATSSGYVTQVLESKEFLTNSATISNLNNCTTYHFYVSAVNDLGTSPESDSVSAEPRSANNQPPTVDAGADQTVSEGETVYLIGTASDSDGSIASYEWSTDSSQITIIDPSLSEANFIAPQVDTLRTFALTLKATDNCGDTASDTVSIYVENNEAPTVSAGADQSAVAGTTVILKGSASDIDGAVVAYYWQETSASSVNSGGVSISRNDSATASITVPELDAGDELTFELTATDDDGSSASAQTKLTVAASGSFKWSFATGGSIYSSPAIALDGSIYFGSDDGKLYALNSDGSEDWNYTTGGMVRSAPAIGADGSIYFGSDDGKLYALNPDGSEDWNYTADGVVRSSPALAADGSIYFGSADGKLYALNPDGSEDWNYTSGSAIHSAPTISSKGMIYFGDSAGIVHELNSSGDVQRFFASAGAIYTSVALDPDNDQLYFSNRNGNIYALSTSSASWDSSLWSFAANNLDSAPVVAEDGTIYIGSFGDAWLNALAADGTILSDKFYSSAGAINATATLGADARIYFSSGNGNLYALDISSATETKLDWEYDIGWSSVSDAPAASTVAIARDGTVYVGSTDGNLYALHSASAGLAASSWPRFAQDNHNLGRINIAPSAEAGNDQDVAAGATVNLDGSSSSDPDGAIVDYYWQETSSLGISITNNSSAQASFTAPNDLSTNATLTIQLTVTDNSGATATDTLEVSVPATNSDPVAQ